MSMRLMARLPPRRTLRRIPRNTAPASSTYRRVPSGSQQLHGMPYSPSPDRRRDHSSRCRFPRRYLSWPSVVTVVDHWIAPLRAFFVHHKTAFGGDRFGFGHRQSARGAERVKDTIVTEHHIAVRRLGVLAVAEGIGALGPGADQFRCGGHRAPVFSSEDKSTPHFRNAARL